MKLDPTALDAAAKAEWELRHKDISWDSVQGIVRTLLLRGTEAAITGYLTAVAPQTRERVDTLINSAQQSMWDNHPDDHERYGAYLSIDKSALLALFGAEEPA